MRDLLKSFWPAVSMAVLALVCVGYGLWYGAQQ